MLVVLTLLNIGGVPVGEVSWVGALVGAGVGGVLLGKPFGLMNKSLYSLISSLQS